MAPVTLSLGAMLAIRPWSAVKAALPEDARRAIQADLEIQNPEYTEAQRLGRWTERIPRVLRMWQHNRATDTLVVPAAYALVIRAWLHRYNVPHVLDDQRAVQPATWPPARVTLRPAQAEAVDVLVRTVEDTGFGMLVAPPGSGKTVMGLEIARRLGQRTLWLTHTRDLADQASTRALEHFGLGGEDVGLLGDGERRAGRVLTVGLIPTLARMGDDEFPATLFGTVVVDECHHLGGGAATWQTTVGRLAARYKLGLTATPKRADGLHAITFLYLGPVTHEIPAADTPGAGAMIPRLHVVRTAVVPKTWAEYERRTAHLARDRRPPAPYNQILDELLADESRNRLITELLARIAPGHHTLVLSARVEHCKHLAGMLAARAPELRVAVVHGEQPAGERRGIIEEARAGCVDVLFSVNVAKEGLDVPRLDQLVLVAGGRDPVYLKQAVGRLLRPAPGKGEVRVWDVVDEAVGVLRAQYWARRRVYRELGMVEPRRKAGVAA